MVNDNEIIIEMVKKLKNSWICALDSSSQHTVVEFAKTLQIELIEEKEEYNLMKIYKIGTKFQVKRALPKKFASWTELFKIAYIIAKFFNIAKVHQEYENSYLIRFGNEKKMFFYPKSFAVDLGNNIILIESRFAEYLLAEELKKPRK